MEPDSIVFGAAGFVGRALVEELLRRGHGVAAAVRLNIPEARAVNVAGLLRRLPRTITGAEPETLSFLSSDRYDTAPARAVAKRPMPPVGPALRRWADDLVATGFGTTAPPPGPYGFQQVAGSRTWLSGERANPSHVLLHGLPLDSTSWSEVIQGLDAPVLAADLPGLLQAPAPRLWRSRFAVPVLRRVTSARLAGALGVPESPATAGAAANLARPGHARRVVAALRAARDDLVSTLARVTVPVEIVTGSADPLTVTVDRPVTVIEGAGHYPQLTHPGGLVRMLSAYTHRS